MEKNMKWKLGWKSALTPAQTSVHMLHVQDLFLWLEKNVAALSKPFIANSHAVP